MSLLDWISEEKYNILKEKYTMTKKKKKMRKEYEVSEIFLFSLHALFVYTCVFTKLVRYVNKISNLQNTSP